MTIYGPDITAALEPYANHFDDLSVAERTSIIDINAINPLTRLRESWQNTTTTSDEHRLEITAGTDDDAYLETKAHGQYSAGYEVQCGMGVRVPQKPVNDEKMRWGYYDVDSNGDPVNGFYYGVNSDGVFVAKARNGVVERVYQDNWNHDTLDGSGKEDRNPSDLKLDLQSGNIFQIEFTYYGFGPIEMQLALDDGIVNVHNFIQDGNTSIDNTNLPIRQEIISNGTNSDALDLYVGGRQFSIIGKETGNRRPNGHYRDTLTGVDDTQWYPAVSVKIKDGTDIGSIDFRHVLSEVFTYEVSNGNSPMRWQIRRDCTLDTVSWETPSSAQGDTDETCMKIDTTATSVGDGNGNPTGIHIDGGTIPSGDNQRKSFKTSEVEGRITSEQVVTLMFKAQPGESGSISAIYMKWTEDW